ncbi:hypothetical protein FLX56_28935 [Synechococcus moorigangaii CMS01]|nr:hypothetical protein [Synechococcus moorigangaii CMS01]
MSDNKDNQKLQHLLSLGSELTGSAASELAGFAISSVLVGPVGAAVGGIAGFGVSQLVKTLADTANKQLSSREETRVGASIIFSIAKIQKKLEMGESIRNDGFFQSEHENLRSSAEEIFEGVLLKSKNTHEEKKIKYISSIFANAAFQSGLAAEEINQILKVAENFTYRQIQCLSLLDNNCMMNSINLRRADYTSHRSSSSKISFLQEIFELNHQDLVVCKMRLTRAVKENKNLTYPYKNLSRWYDIVPDQLKLTELGQKYYQLMDLQEISESELELIAKFLSE